MSYGEDELGRLETKLPRNPQRRDEDRGGGYPYRVSALLAHPLQ